MKNKEFTDAMKKAWSKHKIVCATLKPNVSKSPGDVVWGSDLMDNTYGGIAAMNSTWSLYYTAAPAPTGEYIDVDFGLFYKGRQLANFNKVVAKFIPNGSTDLYIQEKDEWFREMLGVPCDVDEVRAYYKGVQVPLKDMYHPTIIHCTPGYSIMLTRLEIEGIHIAGIDSIPPTANKAVNTISKPIGEKPCRNCTRMNDIGSKSCWWCCLENPV